MTTFIQQSEPLPFTVTALTTEQAVTATELRDHVLLFGDTSRDTELTEFSFAAQQFLDDFMGEFIGSTAIRAVATEFQDELVLPHRYIKAGTTPSLRYFQQGSTTATVVPTNLYFIEDIGPQTVIRRAPGQTWPNDVDRNRRYPVYIDYNAGLTDANGIAPPAIRSAILLIAGELFNIREQSQDRQRYVVPIRAQDLVRNYRRTV